MIFYRSVAGVGHLSVVDTIAPYDGDVVAAMKENPDEPIVLDVVSGGGDVMAAQALRAELVKRVEDGQTVTIHTRGVVASAAAFLCAVSGAHVIAHAGTRFMIHPVSGVAVGTAEEMEKAKNAMAALDASIKDFYRSRLKADDAWLDKAYAAETWISPEEALKVGLIDEFAPDLAKDIEEEKTAAAAAKKATAAKVADARLSARNELMERLNDSVLSSIASVRGQLERIENAMTGVTDRMSSMDAYLTLLNASNSTLDKKVEKLGTDVHAALDHAAEKVNQLDAAIGTIGQNLGTGDLFIARDEMRGEGAAFKPSSRF